MEKYNGSLVAGGAILILLALGIQVIAVVRWRNVIRTYGYGTPERIRAKRQNSAFLSNGALVMTVVLTVMSYESFSHTMDKVHLYAAQVGVLLFSAAILLAMLWAVSDTVCNRDYSLTAEQMEKSIKANRWARIGTILCALVGLICTLYTLLVPNGTTIEIVYPLRFAFGFVVFILGIILVVARRRLEEKALSPVEGREIVVPHNLPIMKLAIGFWLVGIVFMVSSFIP